MRFRVGEYAVSADIKDMFFQVRVPMEDRRALQFLWWSDGDTRQSPRRYQLTSHPFGAVSSPSCTSFALQRAAEMSQEKWMQTVVKQHFYVDDFLMSGDDVEYIGRQADTLRSTLKASGFTLVKWSSNDTLALQYIPVEDRTEVLERLPNTSEGDENYWK